MAYEPLQYPSRRFRAIGPLSSNFVSSPAMRRHRGPAGPAPGLHQVARFHSLDELLAFMTRVLTEMEAQPGAE